MAKSPSDYKDRVLSWNFYCNGTKVNDSIRLSFASVRTGMNKIGKATFKFDTGDDSSGNFDATDSKEFKPGTSIRFDAGEPGKENTLFTGIIIQLKLEIANNSHPQMVLECRDSAYMATLERKNKVFENKDNSAILKEVLSPYGNISIDPARESYPSLVQYYCTDWDFALSRADATGLLIFSHNGKIEIKKPNVSAPPVLTVTYGKDIIDFDGTISSADQYASTKAISWDHSKQSNNTVSASTPNLNKQGDLSINDLKTNACHLLQTDTLLSSVSLQEWVDSLALKSGLARYQGQIEFYGSPEVLPGCILEINGMGKRFNGNAFIGWVEHTFDHNEWRTRAGMGIPATNMTDETDIQASPVSGWLPGISGLHIGKVKKIEDDPGKEFRVLIELPILNLPKELWARISTLYTGNKTGTFFYPEKGDEVIVGFFNNDPSSPVILGSLYSSKQEPPYSLIKENNIKAIVTREKLKIEFNEDDKTITLSTPGNNMIKIDDKNQCIQLTDKHKNEIKTDSNGIHLSSCKDLTLQAKGNISLDAGMKASVNAKSDVTVDGINVKVTAKIGVAVKGSATAELSASGQTVVKGGIVMIN